MVSLATRTVSLSVQKPALAQTPQAPILRNKRIAFTTPSNYALRLAHVLQQHGSSDPLWCPTIIVGPTPHTKSLLKAYLVKGPSGKTPLEDFSAIAFTSRAGISAFSEALNEVNENPLSESGPSFVISALGRDSELLNEGFKLCEVSGRVKILVPSVATPSGLAEEIGEGFGRKILCPVPLVIDLDEPPVVPEFLRALSFKKWDPVGVYAYETKWAGSKCAEILVRNELTVDGMVFTSTAEVQGLLKSLDELGFSWEMVRSKWPKLVVAAHGPVTASGAEKLGVSVDAVSSRFDSFDGVVEALALKLGASNTEELA